jgi:hypothetical protein
MRTRLVLPTAYVALFILALIYMFANASQTPMCGIFAILLTVPWSVVAFVAVAIASPRTLESSLLPGVVIVTLCALLNGGILVFVGARIDRGRHRL